MGGDIFLQEPFPQRDHGRCVRHCGPAGFFPALASVMISAARTAGIGGGNGAMGAYGHLYHPAAIAGLDDIDLASGGVNAHPESLEVVVPDNAFALLAGQCIDGALGNFWPPRFNPLAIGYQAPYRYLERASQGALKRTSAHSKGP